MLGILLLFFAGRIFYKLAEKYNKNKWGFGVLGVVSYIFGFYAAGVTYTVIFFISNPEALISDLNETTVGLISIPFGIITSYIMHYFLKKSWIKYKSEDEKSFNIDDIGTK
ncbi:hypothetical protein AAON49_08670 [Pseudotenacibaculum sp. MALMAid0570]|uniref:hypothetical protein n=1 Tax=Pseudotenacibaculum sp. MALMAid0570 TaxID=3143938 RepID=UPI0032DF4EBF